MSKLVEISDSAHTAAKKKANEFDIGLGEFVDLAVRYVLAKVDNEGVTFAKGLQDPKPTEFL